MDYHDMKRNKNLQPEPRITNTKTELTSKSQQSVLNSNSFSRNDVMQLQRTIGNKGVTQLLQKMIQPSSKEENKPIQRARKDTNNTGLPAQLKAGIESLSGLNMDDVKVHYNSSNPALLNALAYAQGTDIHVAPGQEKHLPHEAWHVVQQARGKVNTTSQMKGMNLNDDTALEHEADVMGQQAMIAGGKKDKPTVQKLSSESLNLQQLASNETKEGLIAEEKIAQTKGKGSTTNSSSTPSVIQLKKGDIHNGEIKYRHSDGVKAIYVADQIRPWFDLPKEAVMNMGDLVSFKEGDSREVTELVVTQQATIVEPITVAEPMDYSSSIDLSKVEITFTGTRYDAHENISEKVIIDHLRNYSGSVKKTSSKNLTSDGWVYSVLLGHGITMNNGLYGQILFNYVHDKNRIVVFHAHGKEKVPTKNG